MSQGNKAIISLLWDLDARNHEITSLRVGNIQLKEQYGEGMIPHNTKTGGGPILLTCSFPYVRDWLNLHPFKNEPKARLICNLHNGASIRPDVIWIVLNRLRLRIKRMVEEDGSIANVEERQKLEYLLGTKKWNPYCFRHSAITHDSDYLPEYAVKKKVRWAMDSKQGARYIKNKMGGELRNKILEHNGIKVTTTPQQRQPAVRTCYYCNYVNRFESKYCENVRLGCNRPLTQEAFEEIKKQEESRIAEIVDARSRKEIQGLKEQVEEIRDLYRGLIRTLDEAADLRAKIRASTNPHILEDDAAKLIVGQKRSMTGRW